MLIWLACIAFALLTVAGLLADTARRL